MWKGNYPNLADAGGVRLHYDGDQLYARVMGCEHHRPPARSTPRRPDDAVRRGAGGAPSGEEVGVRVEVISLAADDSHQQREVDRFKGEGRIAARGVQHAHFVPRSSSCSTPT